MRELVLDPYLRNAALDWLMDATLLWTAAAVLRRRTKWRRIFLGGLVGGVYNLLLALARDAYIPGWTWLSSLPVHLLVLPVVMLFATFAPTNPARFLRLGVIFMFISVLTWGLANAVFYLLRLYALEFSPFLCVCLELGLALGVAEAGWGAVHRQALNSFCQIPLHLTLGELQIDLLGYLDTGNRLRDPLTRRPVVVVDYAMVRASLTPTARAFIEAVAEGDQPPEACPDDPWLSRLRLIPFRTVQRQAGLLPGLRTDEIRLGAGKRTIVHHSLVIGLELAGGLGGDECRALIPTVLWQQGLSA